MDAESLARNAHRTMLLFADCLPVRGATMSAIYDLTRREISRFPSEYFPLIELLRSRPLGEVLAADEVDRDDVLTLLAFLLEREYATFVAEPAAFPPIGEAWDAPCRIQSAIIDVDLHGHDFAKLVRELSALGCQHLQIRSYSHVLGLPELAEVLAHCEGTTIEAIELVLKYDPAISEQAYRSFSSAHRLLSSFILHSAPASEVWTLDHGAPPQVAALVRSHIQLSATVLTSQNDCGTIAMGSFVPPTTATVNELRAFNGCLNRKISVDTDGQIRNCPAMKSSHGHHGTVSLSEVLARPEFVAAWGLRKDEIRVCQDCEYRYACTDCRAFTEDGGDPHAKPLKCGYDPYTNEWRDWREDPARVAAFAGQKRKLRVVA